VITSELFVRKTDILKGFVSLKLEEWGVRVILRGDEINETGGVGKQQT